MGKISSMFDGYFSLNKDINKVKDGQSLEEGVMEPYLEEFTLDTPDEDLIKLSKAWAIKWKGVYEKELKAKQEKALKYWLGTNTGTENDLLTSTANAQADNLIFEALETFLPVATQQNPEPLVLSDETPEGIELAKKIRKHLAYLNDKLSIKTKIKQATRMWGIFYFGVIKVGWDEMENDIAVKVIPSRKMILDPDGFVDDGWYKGEYIGELKTESADTLKRRFKAKADYIDKQVNGKTGTNLSYTEWWTDEGVFWTFKDKVLGKFKNPHWNYDTEKPIPQMTQMMNEYGEEVEVQATDEYGNELTEIEVSRGMNHFQYPKKPYIILNVFTLNETPYDVTSLIEQNIPNQDTIYKRQRQIDENADNINGGWVISLEKAGITKEQASRVAKAIMKGGVAAIPGGSPAEAIQKINGTSLPSDVFNNLNDMRNELRAIFGTTGISSQGIQQESTVRGKIITRQSDSSRIGGGISAFIEQFSDVLYNWLTQMMYVYYDETHSAAILGDEGAGEWVDLINTEMTKKVLVSVKEGSLIPKDPLSQRNEAVELAQGGLLDLESLFSKLDWPNPKETAERVMAMKQGQLLDDTTAKMFESNAGQQIPTAPEPASQDIINQVPIQ